ncbi:SGNH/GDSL hydrolase family protein [Streptomyces sp. LN549]|uniref:SGNH/GDSL hydrolase family protein n=1 Tax=Streptomyces sp. LN549 TaxID=3112979 RepID=UPI00371DADC8
MTSVENGSVRHGSEASDPYVLSAQDIDALLTAAPWSRFAVLGDSLAEGLGEAVPGYQDVPWADRVAAALRRRHPGLEYLNLGVRYLRASEVRARQLKPALDFRPDLVSVVCGGNDMLSRDFSAETVEAELAGLIGPLREAGADVFVFTIQDITAVFPEQLGGGGLRERIQVFNEQVRSVAARYGAMVVDMWSHPTSSSRDVFSSDMLHASMRGHAVLATAVVTTLAEQLAETESP